MRFALTTEASEGVAHRTAIIAEVSSRLSEFFALRDYGSGIATMLIGVICVSPEFDFFSKIRKPKYTAYREYVIEGIPMVEDRVFGYDIKLDYAAFRDQSDGENKRMLAIEIIQSLSNLDRLPATVKDFDRDKLKMDVQYHLRKLI